MRINYKNYSSISDGFTLIEMLVVLAIIVIILSLSISGIGKSMEQARDTQRKNDLNQYNSLLKNYAAKNGGFYPKRSSLYAASDKNNEGGSLCLDLGLDTSDSPECPADPNDGVTIDSLVYRYYYISNGSCDDGIACATWYSLRAVLESSTSFWTVFSDGTSGESSAESDSI